MKQRQVKTGPKTPQQTKFIKKATPQKKIQELIEKNDGEVEFFEEEIVVAKNSVNKRTAVQKVKESFKEGEEEDQEVDKEDQAIDEEDQAVDDEDQAVDEDQADDDQMSYEVQDDEDAEEGMDVEDEEERNDEEFAENEEPTIPSKVKSGEIPSTAPSKKVVHITKLPKKCKKIDVVELFGKYGAIEQIHVVTTPDGTVANVTYKTEKAAKDALAANKRLKVQDSLISVTLKRNRKKPKKDYSETRDRSIYVRHLKAGTTEEQLGEHFKGCGVIERVKLVARHSATFGFVTFNDTASRGNGLKLHNSILNDANIGVYENNENPTKAAQMYDEKLTVMVRNKPAVKNIESSILEDIFAKCGEIAAMDIVCKRNALAYITFKTESAVQKALTLNGKTEKDIELDIELYNPYTKKTTIHISNLHKDCTEEDLRNCFSRAGEIAQVVLRNTYAIIRFEDCNGYCKSFLYNESFINNQIIFVEPHSIRKKAVVNSKIMKNFPKGFKRPAENGNSVFKPKKQKRNK